MVYDDLPDLVQSDGSGDDDIDGLPGLVSSSDYDSDDEPAAMRPPTAPPSEPAKVPVRKAKARSKPKPTEKPQVRTRTRQRQPRVQPEPAATEAPELPRMEDLLAEQRRRLRIEKGFHEEEVAVVARCALRPGAWHACCSSDATSFTISGTDKYAWIECSLGCKAPFHYPVCWKRAEALLQSREGGFSWRSPEIRCVTDGCHGCIVAAAVVVGPKRQVLRQLYARESVKPAKKRSPPASVTSSVEPDAQSVQDEPVRAPAILPELEEPDGKLEGTPEPPAPVPDDACLQELKREGSVEEPPNGARKARKDRTRKQRGLKVQLDDSWFQRPPAVVPAALPARAPATSPVAHEARLPETPSALVLSAHAPVFLPKPTPAPAAAAQHEQRPSDISDIFAALFPSEEKAAPIAEPAPRPSSKPSKGTCSVCNKRRFDWFVTPCAHPGPCEACMPDAALQPALYPQCLRCGAAVGKIHRVFRG